MKLFGKFSFEPTFYPSVVPPDYIFNDKMAWISYLQVFNKYNKLRKKTRHKWHKMSHYDSCVLEAPTGIYSDYDVFKNDYRSYLKILNKYSYVPSSCISLEDEGGCHINIDMSHMQGYHGNDFCISFIQNLRTFLYNNPSIAWAFLSPYDNNSAHVTYISNIFEYEKGDMLTVRYETKSELIPGSENVLRITRHYNHFGQVCYQSTTTPQYKNTNIVEYVELRFFMMPRTEEEFDVHFEFANALMEYIYGVTKDKQTIPKVSNWTARKYEEVIKQIQTVCKEISFNYNKLVDVGKPQMIQDRIDLGYTYLV